MGQALKGVNHDNCFLPAKLGILPSPEGGAYGLDVKPLNVKGRLTYSLRRLGLEYIDLYQPVRQEPPFPRRRYAASTGGYNIMGGPCPGYYYPVVFRSGLPGNDHHPNITFRIALYLE